MAMADEKIEVRERLDRQSVAFVELGSIVQDMILLEDRDILIVLTSKSKPFNLFYSFHR
jgi:hypothetical protein